MVENEFDVKGMSDEELRQIIIESKEEAYGRGLARAVTKDKRKRDGTARKGGGGKRTQDLV